MQKYLFQSERLGFRNWQESDLVPFAEMNADPIVMEFFPKTLTTDETAAMIQRMQGTFESYGYTFYAVETLNNQAFIGFIGMIYQTMEADFTPCAEVGWRLKKSAWGKGYATEGAKRCLEYGFSELGFTEIYSFAPSINNKSERVMQKIGMEKIGAFLHPKVESGHILEPHILYSTKKK